MEGLISSSSGKSVKTSYAIRELPLAERRKQALKGLGLCWAISLGTIPLPPIHWVTVPFFFFFGFYWAVKKFRESAHFMPFHFPCPECGGDVPVPEQAVQTPLAITCPHCRYGLKLTL